MNERQMQNALESLLQNLIDAQRFGHDEIEMPDGMGTRRRMNSVSTATAAPLAVTPSRQPALARLELKQYNSLQLAAVPDEVCEASTPERPL